MDVVADYGVSIVMKRKDHLKREANMLLEKQEIVKSVRSMEATDADEFSGQCK